MKQIELTQGKVALVDDENYDYLNQWRWYAIKEKNGNFYAVRVISISGKQVRLWMHRVVLNINDKKVFTDHCDRNGLNNQRSNLRIATQSQNECNKVSYTGSVSKYKGVNWDKNKNKWQARICKNRVRISLGVFDNEKDAALAYNIKALELHQEFANLNII